MKTPLRYQATEYDCGPTSMTNAIVYMFEREEIPPDLIRHIGQGTISVRVLSTALMKTDMPDVTEPAERRSVISAHG